MQTANSRLRESAASKAHKKTHLSKAERAPDARRARALRCSGIPSRKQKPLHPSSSLLPLVYGKILPRFSSLRKQKIRPKLCRYCQLTSLFRVRLAEFRPAGRNKMEIHVIRRLCRPETYLSLRKCELFTQHVKSLRAVEVHFPIKKRQHAVLPFFYCVSRARRST